MEQVITKQHLDELLELSRSKYKALLMAEGQSKNKDLCEGVEGKDLSEVYQSALQDYNLASGQWRKALVVYLKDQQSR